MSDFELKNLHCLGLGIRKHTRIRFYAWKFLQGVEFELNPLKLFRFWNKKNKTCQKLKKNLRSKKHVFNYVTPWKRSVLHFRCPLEKHDFELEILQWVTIGFQKITNSQTFCLMFLQGFTIWIKTFERFQFLLRISQNESEFE